MKRNPYHAVAQAVSKSESRPELLNVNFQDGSATATDSFILVKATSGAFAGINGQVPGKQLTAKTLPESVISLATPKDNFPNTESLLSSVLESPVKESVTVNYELLIRALKAVGAFSTSINDVTIEFRGAGHAVVLKTKRVGEEAVGLVMPLRM